MYLIFLEWLESTTNETKKSTRIVMTKTVDFYVEREIQTRSNSHSMVSQLHRQIEPVQSARFSFSKRVNADQLSIQQLLIWQHRGENSKN